MDWAKVVAVLDNEWWSLTERAQIAFPNDPATQQEMRTRAQIARMLGDALRAGLDDPPPPR